MGVILAAISWRWRIAYLVLTVATFANMYVVLTTLYPDNPSVADWLGIGPAIRSPGRRHAVLADARGRVRLGLRAAARRARTRRSRTSWPRRRSTTATDVEDADDIDRRRDPRRCSGTRDRRRAAVAPRPAPRSWRWRWWTRRASAARRRRAPIAPTAPAASPPPAVPAGAPLPTWTPRPRFEELGIIGWFRARLSDLPIRPDRSALLRSEGGGRLDRLDLWFVHRARRRVDGPADLPARGAVPDALRRGLPRADRGRVPPGLAIRAVPRHLRMDPPAPGQVRDGRRARPVGRGRRGRHERPGGAGRRGRRRTETHRRDRHGARGPASGSTSRPAPRSGPTTSRRAISSRSSPRPG